MSSFGLVRWHKDSLFCTLQSQLKDPSLILCILDLALGNICFDRKLYDWTDMGPLFLMYNVAVTTHVTMIYLTIQ